MIGRSDESKRSSHVSAKESHERRALDRSRSGRRRRRAGVLIRETAPSFHESTIGTRPREGRSDPLAHLMLMDGPMAREAHHERLSALDATFLGIEDRCCHMHIGSVGMFEAPSGSAGGGLDIDGIHHLVSAVLDGVPRYRQRLETIPLLQHPVWVGDASVNLHYHLRHTRLPLPGDERQLKRLAGRLMSQQLDRGKPLWE